MNYISELIKRTDRSVQPKESILILRDIFFENEIQKPRQLRCRATIDLIVAHRVNRCVHETMSSEITDKIYVRAKKKIKRVFGRENLKLKERIHKVLFLLFGEN